MFFHTKYSNKNVFCFTLVASLLFTLQAQAASAHQQIYPQDLTHFSEGLIPQKFRMVENLCISGSHQLTEPEFQILLRTIPHKNITIVDLREEPHFMASITETASVTGPKVNAYNGLTSKEIQRLENGFTDRFPAYQTEKTCVEGLGMRYLRIPVTDVTRPKDSDVDTFITFLRSIEGQNNWLHFHCLAGQGRTTTFMAMYEMIKMAPSKDSFFEDILDRHRQIGGANLKNMWYSCSKTQWLNFLRNFYDYAENGFHKGMSWSHWVVEKRLQVFQQQPSITSWWSLKGFASYGRCAAMLFFMRGLQLYRTVMN